MENAGKSWFSCCNGEAVQHDKWQDIDPRAKNAAQREIDMITGKIPTQPNSSSNTHT